MCAIARLQMLRTRVRSAGIKPRRGTFGTVRRQCASLARGVTKKEDCGGNTAKSQREPGLLAPGVCLQQFSSRGTSCPKTLYTKVSGQVSGGGQPCSSISQPVGRSVSQSVGQSLTQSASRVLAPSSIAQSCLIHLTNELRLEPEVRACNCHLMILHGDMGVCQEGCMNGRHVGSVDCAT